MWLSTYLCVSKFLSSNDMVIYFIEVLLIQYNIYYDKQQIQERNILILLQEHIQRHLITKYKSIPIIPITIAQYVTPSTLYFRLN